MKRKMSPREALYNICLQLGPVPMTNRGDNITHREVELRDSIRTLQNFIDYRSHGDSIDGLELEDFHHHSHEQQLNMDYGDTE